MKLFLNTWPAQKTQKGRLLMLHGMGGTGALWRPLAASLEDTITCLAPDQRGHGKSQGIGRSRNPSIPPSYSPLAYGEDLVALLEESEHRPLYVLGHSMGVRSACGLAHLKPEWVQGLILIDLGFSGAAGGGMGESLASFMKSFPMRFDDRASAREYMAAHAPDLSMGQYLMAVSQQQPDKSVTFPFDRAALIETIHAARDQSVRKWVENFGGTGKPVLALRGELSRVWSAEEFEREKSHFAGFSNIIFETVPGVGHGLPFEARAWLSDKISQLITQTP